MEHYFSVDEISAETDIHRNTLYAKAKKLGVDTSRIGQTEKQKLIDACAETLERKREAQEFISGAEVGESEMISLESASTLEQRLYIAKKEFNLITKSLADCQMVIDRKGTIIMNPNGAVSMNPAVKTKCELLKQQNALQKTISDLESSLKITAPIQKHSVIDDE